MASLPPLPTAADAAAKAVASDAPPSAPWVVTLFALLRLAAVALAFLVAVFHYLRLGDIAGLWMWIRGNEAYTGAMALAGVIAGGYGLFKTAQRQLRQVGLWQMARDLLEALEPSRRLDAGELATEYKAKS